jgi:DNA-3-methyladenine glycosylase
VLAHGETRGVIVETEAYHETEAACHAHIGLTRRTSTLFGHPGTAYVYRSYGIHALLNAVCEPPGVGAAVLIRALEPLDGIEIMRDRRRVASDRHRGDRGPRAGYRDLELCSGPGKLTIALGIELELNGSSLLAGPVTIGPRPPAWRDVELVADRRIGITKAAELPWRFTAAGSRWVSRPARPR